MPDDNPGDLGRPSVSLYLDRRNAHEPTNQVYWGDISAIDERWVNEASCIAVTNGASEDQARVTIQNRGLTESDAILFVAILYVSFPDAIYSVQTASVPCRVPASSYDGIRWHAGTAAITVNVKRPPVQSPTELRPQRVFAAVWDVLYQHPNQYHMKLFKLAADPPILANWFEAGMADHRIATRNCADAQPLFNVAGAAITYAGYCPFQIRANRINPGSKGHFTVYANNKGIYTFAVSGGGGSWMTTNPAEPGPVRIDVVTEGWDDVPNGYVRSDDAIRTDTALLPAGFVAPRTDYVRLRMNDGIAPTTRNYQIDIRC